jgi:hypothetical protein
MNTRQHPHLRLDDVRAAQGRGERPVVAHHPTAPMYYLGRLADRLRLHAIACPIRPPTRHEGSSHANATGISVARPMTHRRRVEGR